MIFQIRIVTIGEDGQEQIHEIPYLQRTELKPETLGLTLAEGKAILREIQRVVAKQQIADAVSAHRSCSACGQPRPTKGQHQLSLRTVFGKITVPSPRFLHCDCQPHETKSFSLLAQMLPERTTPRVAVSGHQMVFFDELRSDGRIFTGGSADGLSAACFDNSRARVPRGPTARERVGRGAVVFY
jgi:hypothetical protein